LNASHHGLVWVFKWHDFDRVFHPRSLSDVIASPMPNSLRIYCTAKSVTTVLSPERM
jgi:hypothetical protein